MADRLQASRVKPPGRQPPWIAARRERTAPPVDAYAPLAYIIYVIWRKVSMSALAVAKKLGGRGVLHRKIASDRDLIEAVRAGLPAKALDHVLKDWAKQLSQGDVYRVVGRARTLQRKRTRGTSLSADESDRLVRLARILVRAEEALGDEEKARCWLTEENRALGGDRPLSLLDSDAGTLAVERVLGRIEHGVYS